MPSLPILNQTVWQIIYDRSARRNLLCQFESGSGREQQGRRPVLVISADAINQRPLVVTVVVGTDGANVSRDYPTNVRVGTSESGLPIETVFLCFQIRSLDHSRFPDQPSGKVTDAVLRQIETAVRCCLGL